MAESGFPTIGHEQVLPFIVPITVNGASTIALTTVATQMAQMQIDRCQSAGFGAFDLAIRKRYELGRLAAMEKVPSASIDKPATLEVNENGSMQFWNHLAGKDYDNTADITEADFDATTSEFGLLLHKLNEAKTQVIESQYIWRCVVDTPGISVPSSEDDDVRRSVRITGDEHVYVANSAGMIIPFLDTAIASVVTMEAAYAGAVERDDWPDDDDGSNAITSLTADPALGATSVTVQEATNFSIGHDIIIGDIAGNSFETARITNKVGEVLTLQDALDIDHGIGTEVKRTRGFFYHVRNADTSAYLVLGDDYRVVKTDANTLTIINVDGGTAIGATDDVWVAYSVASGALIWTANDTDLYGVPHTYCRAEIAPESTFNATTAGYTESTETHDTDLDFEGSGTDVDTEWYGLEFATAAGVAGQVGSITVEMKKTGAPGGDIYAMIFSDDGGAPSLPDAQLGNPSMPVRASTLNAAGADVTFNFVEGPTLAASTTYWLVFKTTNYIYADGVTEIILRTDADGAAASDSVIKGDPNATPIWTVVHTDHGSNLVVTLIGAQEIKRLQGMEASVTFSRTKYSEMGNTQPIERSFDETDVRVTLPGHESDITTLARVVNKNPAHVRVIRPEQNPESYFRLNIYGNDQRLAADHLLSYEFGQVQRTGGESTAPANERMSKRVTLTGDSFTIASSL